MNALLVAAHQYVAAHLSVIPIASGTRKNPDIRWRQFQARIPETVELQSWFGAAPALAIVCGRISGNLTVLDFDKHTDHDPCYDDWCALVDVRCPGLLETLPLVGTQHGGKHVYLRCSLVDGNEKLATSASYSKVDTETGEARPAVDPFIETRGQGGYVLAPPTPGYTLLRGDLQAVPLITPEQYAVLLETARLFQEDVPTDVVAPLAANAQTAAGDQDRPGDLYNRKATVADVLALLTRHGWHVAYTAHDGRPFLTRPHKAPRDGASANIKVINGVPIFYNFSAASADFGVRGYTPFQVFGLLEHHGNWHAAAKAAYMIVYPGPIPITRGVQWQRDQQQSADAPPVQEPDRGEGGYELTDTGNADRFVDAYRTRYRYKLYGEDTGSWLRWDTRRWELLPLPHVVDDAKVITRDLLAAAVASEDARTVKRLVAHALRSQQKERLTAMVTLARGTLAVHADAFDTNPWLLNCANGVVDLRTGALSAHSQDLLISRLVDIVYTPEATCPTFLAFLARIQPDAAMRTFLQRALGYGCTGSTREQSLFFLHGSGSNGKSTLLNIIRRVLGDYAAHTGSETLMQRGERTQTNDLAALIGARFVTTVEVEDGRRLAESLVKELTGGDPITVKFLYKEFFTYTPIFKIFLAANHKPVIRGQDEGIWRRIRLIPFTVHIQDAEKDDALPEKLWAERAGILAWLVRGAQAWYATGLSVPETVRQATADYRSEMDVLAAFLEECCVVAADQRTERTALFAAYSTWCDQTKERAYTQRVFASRLLERGYATHASSGKRYWRGIALRTGTPTMKSNEMEL